MKETKKCPNCGFEGTMDCWKTADNEDMCKCPNCKFTFNCCNVTFVKPQKIE